MPRKCKFGEYFDKGERRCKGIEGGGRNWSIEKKDRGFKFSLHDHMAGWVWDGEEDQATGFLVRMSKSKVKGEFIDQMDEMGIKPKHLKKLFIEAAEDGDGLYEISGDNAKWRFGGDPGYEPDEQDELRILKEEEGFSDKEAHEILNEAYSNAYSPYKKYATPERKKEWAKKVKEIFNQEQTWADVMGALNDEKFQEHYVYDTFDFDSEAFYEALSEARAKHKK